MKIKNGSKKLIVSLFCGVGGLDLGFEAAGFEIALAVDNNPKVLAAYQKNFPDTLTLCKNIANLNPEKIKELVKQKYPQWHGKLAAVIGDHPANHLAQRESKTLTTNATN